MKILNHIHSVFLKKCPHCGKFINIYRLRKIPHSAPLRWNQFTPAPQMACPECNSLVRSSVENSPTLAIALGMPITISLTGAFIPIVRDWIAALPGGLYSLVLPALLVVWFVFKHSELHLVNKDR